MKSKYNWLQAELALCTCLASAVHADVVLDGSLGTAPPLAGPNYEITANMGQIKGDNLFHSFSKFDLNQNESANFSGPTTVQNIFGRITDNSPSRIDGTISSSITGANLFLMNPHGILFGPNATVNITGSFHATTADYLKFDDNKHFYADLTLDTTLSVAAASAFGFMDDNIGTITLNGAQIAVNEGNTLSIIGGDISLTQGAKLSAPNGRVNIASAASQGEMDITPEDTDPTAFVNYANINLSSESTIDASGNTGGRVVIRGNQLTLQSATISADTMVSATQTMPNIDIKTNDSITVDKQSKITADLKPAASGTPGGITIETHQLSVQNQSAIQSETESLSTGNAGNISIDAKHIDINERSKISTSTSSTGNSGAITINKTETLNISNASAITTAANWVFGEGESGDINITADYINIVGLEAPKNPEIFDFNKVFSGDFTGIDAGYSILNGNNTGNIDITTTDLTISNIARIRTNTTFGFSGDIQINSQNITVESGSAIISENTAGSGSGSITINNLNNVLITGASPTANVITNKFNLSSIKTAGGNSNIFIKANSIKILNGAQVANQVEFGGQGIASGDITLQAQSIELSGVNNTVFEAAIADGSDIETATSLAQSKISSTATVTSVADFFSNGAAAGLINITSNRLIVTDQAIIEAESNSVFGFENSGESGNIEIDTNYATFDNAKITAQATQANGGNINITSGAALIIQNSDITSSVKTDNGNGGNINISSDLFVLDNSNISATAFSGNGGDIGISAKTLVMTDNNTIDATSEVGINGEKNIHADRDIKSSLEKLPINVIDTSKLFTTTCNAAKQDSHSNLTVISHDTLDPATISILPSEYRYSVSQNKNIHGNNITTAHNLSNESLLLSMQQFNADCQINRDQKLN
ncbi:MAG: filamentous hemagglutinin N-terminal domain-containing protein [Gammaproteobacteria bacterium]|nr:filamentous hemagglutinin N-terminal domain-containing protein [Gammaproteobacteria bacterium]